MNVLVKLSPGVNFIKVPQAAFARADPKSAKNSDNFTVFLHFWDMGSISSTFYIQLLRAQIPEA